MKDWKRYHGNKGDWDEDCVPSRNEEGTPYCATHGGDARGFFSRRFSSFPDELNLKGFDLPPKDYGWKCPFAQERTEIWANGWEEGLNS